MIIAHPRFTESSLSLCRESSRKDVGLGMGIQCVRHSWVCVPSQTCFFFIHNHSLSLTFAYISCLAYCRNNTFKKCWHWTLKTLDFFYLTYTQWELMSCQPQKCGSEGYCPPHRMPAYICRRHLDNIETVWLRFLWRPWTDFKCIY